MKNGTKEAIRERATVLIGEHPNNLEKAHSSFVNECTARFDSDSEGLTRDDYNVEAQSIWDEAKLQAGARSQEQGEDARARR